jgi:hypothetical protein
MSVWLEGIEADSEEAATDIALHELNYGKNKRYFKVNGDSIETIEE